MPGRHWSIDVPRDWQGHGKYVQIINMHTRLAYTLGTGPITLYARVDYGVLIMPNRCGLVGVRIHVRTTL